MHKNLNSLMLFSFLFCINHNLLSGPANDDKFIAANKDQIEAQQQFVLTALNKAAEEQAKKQAEEKQKKCLSLTKKLIDIVAFEKWAKENNVNTIQVSWRYLCGYVGDKGFKPAWSCFTPTTLCIQVNDVELVIDRDCKDLLDSNMRMMMRDFIFDNFGQIEGDSSYSREESSYKLSDILKHMEHRLKSELEKNKCSNQD